MENTPSGPQDLEKEQPQEPENMQVSVLITMPNPRQPYSIRSNGSTMSLKGKERTLNGDGEELPELVIGVTELMYPNQSQGEKQP